MAVVLFVKHNRSSPYEKMEPFSCSCFFVREFPYDYFKLPREEYGPTVAYGDGFLV